MKDKIALKAGEVIDGTFMSSAALVSFLEAQIEDAKKQGVLFSIHLKATMMKISDPIIFGYAVRTFFRDVFDKHAAVFKEIGVDPNNGLGDLYAAIRRLPQAKQTEIAADIEACYVKRPALAMVNSDKGITNLHVPSDVIIDASIPPMIRDSGQMWGRTASSARRRRSSPTTATRRCIARRSSSASSMARSTRGPWAPFRTSG